MADAPFDVVVFRPLEKAVCSDWNRLGSQLRRTIQLLLRAGAEYRAGQGASDAALQQAAFFESDGFKVRPASPAAMSVQVTAGLGMHWLPGSTASSIGSVIDLDDLEGASPLLLTAAKTIAVPTADATHPRLDIVEVKASRALADSESRDFLDVGTETLVPALVTKTLGFSLDAVVPSINGSAAINYKTGTPDAAPVEPSVSAGYVKIGVVRVEAGATSVVGTKIIDARLPARPIRVTVHAFINTSTWAFSATPTIVAPPGVVVGVQTYSNSNGFGMPAVECLVFAQGALAAGGAAAADVRFSDGNLSTAGDAATPLVANTQTGVTTNASGTLGGGAVTAFYPNPSPELPVGQLVASVLAYPLKWNAGATDWTGTLPNPMQASFSFDIPVRA